MIDGKIDLKRLDMSRMLPFFVDGLPGFAYTLIAYSNALKCKVRLVIWIMPDKKCKLFFSTDTTLSGEEVLDFYRTRFQIEFCLLIAYLSPCFSIESLLAMFFL